MTALIDEQAIERARSGVYTSRISSDLSQGRLNRFFHETAGGWQINKAVRSLCILAPHDVTRDPPYSRLDLICCRNLMIYFGSTLQRRVLQIFLYALKPAGFLLMGASEGVGSSSDLFRLENKESKIYAKQSNASAPTYDFVPARRDAGRETRDGQHESSGLSEPEIRKEADRRGEQWLRGRRRTAQRGGSGKDREAREGAGGDARVHAVDHRRSREHQ